MGDFCQTLRGIDSLLKSFALKEGDVGGESLTPVLREVGNEDEGGNFDELLLYDELLGDTIGIILLFRCCCQTNGSSR